MADIDDADGLTVVLTPIQLAAVLQEESLTRPQTLGNRFWGALGVIGGAVDMVASVPLWLAPEPTLATKVAAGALDYVGADIAWTGMKQVWTGRQQITVTAEMLGRSLRSLGVDPKVAADLSSGTDIAMNMAALIATPLSVARAANAARVTSVERGLIDLEIEETFPGAHTIREHVGKTIAELQARLARTPRLTTASSFRTLEGAERAVSAAMVKNAAAIQTWASQAGVGAKMAFEFRAATTVGVSVSRATGVAEQVSGVRIVLKKLLDAHRVYYLLTAFPIK
jgi:hypothetical protein